MTECHSSDSYSAPHADIKTPKILVGTQLQGFAKNRHFTAGLLTKFNENKTKKQNHR